MFQHLRQTLHRGEADRIAPAMEFRRLNPLLILDDSAARTVAELQGIPFAGTPRILPAAKKSGNLHRIEPLLESLRRDARFWISEKLWHTVLQRAGEIYSAGIWHAAACLHPEANERRRGVTGFLTGNHRGVVALFTADLPYCSHSQEHHGTGPQTDDSPQHGRR